ncbi:MAG: hypothetical protein ACRD7E_30615, partial [Bryobacteraceae bacterium]
SGVMSRSENPAWRSPSVVALDDGVFAAASPDEKAALDTKKLLRYKFVVLPILPGVRLFLLLSPLRPR